MKYIAIYLILINALSLLLMLIDKIKAKKKLWRIPPCDFLTLFRKQFYILSYQLKPHQ